MQWIVMSLSRYSLPVDTRCRCYVWLCSSCMRPQPLPLTRLLHMYRWFVPDRAPLTRSSPVSSIFSLAHPVFSPSIHYPLPPIHTVPSFNVPLCPLSLSPLRLFFSPHPSCLLPLHSPACSPQCRLSRLICTVRFCSWLVPPWLSDFSLCLLCSLFLFFSLLYLTIYITSHLMPPPSFWSMTWWWCWLLKSHISHFIDSFKPL